MNPFSISPIIKISAIGIFSLLTIRPALAIEPPPDNAKPPEALIQGAEKADEVADKLPFIGVVTESLPEMVADHLNLKPGTGVIVRTVSPDSPAAKSGIKTNDIVLKINETDVNDPETLRAEIRSKKIGDKLKLKTIQKGKPANLEVTLAERPADAFADIQDEQQLLEGVPGAQNQLLQNLLELNFGGELGEDGIEEMIVPELLADERLQKMLRGRMNILPQGDPQIQPEHGNNLRMNMQSTMRMEDGNGSIELKSTGDNKEVTVRDKANKTIWSGPWDTDQDKAAAPDEIRQRIEKMNINNGGGLKLQFGR